MVKPNETNNELCITLRGDFYFHGNITSEFKGPIIRGLRLLFWGESYKKATSCSFIKNSNIQLGKHEITDIVILSPKSIDKELEVGQTYAIGMPEIKIGEFRIIENLGPWKGKVP